MDQVQERRENGSRAKVIGAVRLGLVDSRDVMRELNTEEMQRVPEIHTLVYESLLYSYIPSSSKLGEDQTKLRSTDPVRSVCIIVVLVTVSVVASDL